MADRRWVAGPDGLEEQPAPAAGGMTDQRRVELLLDGMDSGGLTLTPADRERLGAVFAAAMPRARAGELTPDVLRELLRDPSRRGGRPGR